MALEQITFNIAAFNDNDAGGNNYYDGVIYEVFNMNDTLADIFSDASGTSQINQDGIANVSDDVGGVLFFIDAGNYYFTVGDERRDFKAGDLDVSALKANDIIQDEKILALEEGQQGGVIVFQTYAILDAYTPANTAEERTSYKVANDPDSSLNGYYSWVSGTSYIKDADLVTNTIEESNTSVGVSGKAVSDYTVAANERGNIDTKNLELVRPINVFEVGTQLDGQYYGGGGQIVDDVDFYGLPKTPCTEGDVIRWSNDTTKAVSYFDSDGVYLSGETATQSTAPLGAFLFSIATRYTDSAVTELMVMLNRTMPTTYVSFDKKYLNADVDGLESNYNKNQANGYLGLDSDKEFKASFNDCFDSTINLFNINKRIDDGYYGTNGSFNSDTDFFSTPFIEIEEGEQYSSNDTTAKIWVWYDENKAVISGVAGVSPQTAPSGAYYLTKAYKYFEGLEDSMLIKSATQPVGFTPYGYTANELLVSNANSPLSGKVIAGLGDSITFGYIPRNYPGYPGQLNSYLPKIAEKFGALYENYGISGTSLSTGSSQPANNFMSRYASMRDDADLIIVMGGTNDVRTSVPLGSFGDQTTGTFYGDLYLLCEGLLNKYRYNQGTTTGKDKKIVFMTAIRLGTTLDVNLPLFNAATIETCKYFNIPVFDAYNESGLTPELFKTLQGTEPGYTGIYNPYVTDGTHPTEEGNDIFADAVHGFISTLY